MRPNRSPLASNLAFFPEKSNSNRVLPNVFKKSCFEFALCCKCGFASNYRGKFFRTLVKHAAFDHHLANVRMLGPWDVVSIRSMQKGGYSSVKAPHRGRSITCKRRIIHALYPAHNFHLQFVGSEAVLLIVAERAQPSEYLAIYSIRSLVSLKNT